VKLQVFRDDLKLAICEEIFWILSLIWDWVSGVRTAHWHDLRLKGSFKICCI
jgi:hypothetical protein